MQAEIGSTIKQEMDVHEKSGRNLMPVEEVDLGVEVRCTDVLEHLFQTQARITQLAVSRISSKA